MEIAMRVCPQCPATPRRPPRPFALLLACLLAAVAQAQGQPPPADTDDAGDPPDRVARLAYQAGGLDLLPAGAQTWSAADVNRPLTRGDRLASGPGARAELELDGAALRLAGDTDFGFLDLGDRLAQVELTRGSLNLAVRRLAGDERYEVDTPTVAVVVDRPGAYRIDVDGGGHGTRVAVFRGGATAYGDGDARQPLDEARSYRFGDAALRDVAVGELGGGDDFDAWCGDRDRRYAAPASGQYVSADVVGYQDLDDYGSWQDVDDYGPVWYPASVPAGWAPYRDGRWAWVAPWGWTWVDAAPWGFAPYHYGRWAYLHGAWGWMPGPHGARPVYAPALVAFVGAAWPGRGRAPVGWFPLGPGEVYSPWYRASRRYYVRVNLANLYARRDDRAELLGRIDRQYGYFRSGQAAPGLRYANRDAPRGLTAVAGETFAGARPVRGGLVNLDPRAVAVLPRGVAMRPDPASPAAAQAAALRASGFDRPVATRRAPPPAFASRSTVPARAGLAVAPRADMRVPGGRVTAMTAGAAAAPRTPAVYRPVVVPAGITPLPRPGLRPGELPSARFVRTRSAPGGGFDAATRPAFAHRPDDQPRPGVSFIANDAGNRQRATFRSGGPLPRVSRFEPAAGEASPQRSFRTGDPAPPQQPPRFQPMPRYGQAPRFAPPAPQPRFQLQDFRPERPQQAERPHAQEAAHAQHAPAPRQDSGGRDRH
jgi:hypothetical protein